MANIKNIRPDIPFDIHILSIVIKPLNFMLSIIITAILRTTFNIHNADAIL